MSSSAERMARLRERRAAAWSVPVAVPRAPEDRLLPSVEVTLAALNLGPEDAAIAAMLRLVAGQVDELDDQVYAYRRFGPLLRKLLDQLGATPMARARHHMVAGRG